MPRGHHAIWDLWAGAHAGEGRQRQVSRGTVPCDWKHEPQQALQTPKGERTVDGLCWKPSSSPKGWIPGVCMLDRARASRAGGGAGQLRRLFRQCFNLLLPAPVSWQPPNGSPTLSCPAAASGPCRSDGDLHRARPSPPRDRAPLACRCGQRGQGSGLWV